MNLVFALFPIALLIVLMTAKNGLSSDKALPLTAFVTWIIALAWFRRPVNLVHAAVVDGLLTALTPILIVFGAIFVFRSMEKTGSMAVVNRWLNGISPNKVAQLMIVGWAFEFLIEGAGGFGTPAALAAPILVGLGFPVLPAAAFALVTDSVPVSFGAVGTPTWFGFSAIDGLETGVMAQIGWKTALMNSAAALIVPVIALRILVDWKTIWRNALFIYSSILITVVPHAVTAIWSYEFPSLVGGLVGLLGTVGLASIGFGLSADLSQGNEVTDEKVHFKDLVRALFPIWGTLLALLLTRIPIFGLKALLNASEPRAEVVLGSLGVFSVSPSLVMSLKGIFGTPLGWSIPLLYVPGIVPFVVVGLLSLAVNRSGWSSVRNVFGETAQRMATPLKALFGALVFVNLLSIGGDSAATMIIGVTLATALGGAWSFFAPYLGALGSFFSGSNTISNLTFGGIQYSIARQLGLSPSTVLAAQSSGGAMGNMVCIHNIVAACSVLGLTRSEGAILKKTVTPMVVYGIIVGGVSVILTATS